MVLLDNTQGDSSQDSRTSKLQKEDFRICLVRLIERQARSIESCICRILIRPNCSSSQKTIRISDLLLLVYKGNPKHVFNKTFQREKSVPSLYLGFYTQKALSYLLPVLFLEESQDPML